MPPSRARSLIPYLADAVPGWFQAVLRPRPDESGREVAYNDDSHFNPDPTLSIAVPRDGTYVLEINDSLYRGRQDFIYRIALGELPLITGLFPLGLAGQSGRQFGRLEPPNDPPSSTRRLLARPDGVFLSNRLPSNAVAFAFDRDPNKPRRSPMISRRP
ncbi:MAG: hypothetical protein U1F61_17880 [Opitutaceae bacterium]